jgi:hypothetical protein
MHVHGPPSCRALLVGAGLAVATWLHAPLALADAKADARALYDQGAAAFDAGNYPRAASLLADADAMAPNATVLKLALGASLRTDDGVLGEDLALRADARGDSRELMDLSARVHQRFRAKVARVKVLCREGRACPAHLGTTRWLGGETHAVAPGVVDVLFDEAGSHVRVEVGAGQVGEVSEPPPPGALGASVAAAAPGTPPDTTQGSSSSGAGGLPSVVFWGGVALTACLTGATIASGIDTQERRDQFLAARTVANQSAGESAEVRTNVLLVGAVASAAATAALGIFFTRWHASPAIMSSLSGRIAW